MDVNPSELLRQAESTQSPARTVSNLLLGMTESSGAPAAKIRIGVVTAFDTTSWTATCTISGSTLAVPAIPTLTAFALVPGVTVLLLQFGPSYVVAGPLESTPTPYSARVKTGATSYATSTFTDIDVAVNRKTVGITYSAGTWTVQRSGRYFLNLNWTWEPNATGRRIVTLNVNGAVTCRHETAANGTQNTHNQITKIQPLNVGDTIVFQCWQNAGVNVQNIVNEEYVNAQISWMGEQ